MVPVNRLMAAGALFRLGVRNAARLALRRRRSLLASHAEYETRWSGTVAKGEWQQLGTLDDYLFSTDTAPHVAMIDGDLVKVAGNDYRRYRHHRLCAELSRLLDPKTHLIELGSGTGGNLLGLASNRAPWKLTGLELTQSGVAAARAVAARYQLSIDFQQADILRDDLSVIRGNAAFTYYCLEQLPHDTEQAIENILKAGPRIVVHFEPAYELLKLWKPLDLVTWLYILSRDYQRSLLATLRRLESRGMVEVLEARTLNYAPTPQHFPMLLVWRPKAQG